MESLKNRYDRIFVGVMADIGYNDVTRADLESPDNIKKIIEERIIGNNWRHGCPSLWSSACSYSQEDKEICDILEKNQVGIGCAPGIDCCKDFDFKGYEDSIELGGGGCKNCWTLTYYKGLVLIGCLNEFWRVK